ncbi:MAG: glycosyltransferase family 2 protein [Ilumatobacteraceae bacterium]|nr:glycosyltransferase family 2 protein [Ilumatobacteraceae bacterium]
MIVAVVVTYSAHDELVRCVKGLIDDPLIDCTVVVDNSGHVELPPHERVEIVAASSNGGFAGGANLGFAHARRLGADWLVLLNDDVEFPGTWLPDVLDAFDSADVGAVQPLLVGESGLVESAGVVLDRFGAGTDADRGSSVDVLDVEPFPILMFTGGAVVFRPAFLDQTAGFDERFFLYYEDVDLARRGTELGWVYRCAPRAQVLHRPGTSSSKLGAHVVYLRERNRLWATVRHGSASMMARSFGLALRRCRHEPRRAHITALLAGLRGTPRRLVERYRARRA